MNIFRLWTIMKYFYPILFYLLRLICTKKEHFIEFRKNMNQVWIQRDQKKQKNLLNSIC